ncbi:hypothetical protein MMC13_002218 [Lambiella insularis]|nr:hypothetical protein [Lambiella insularis]
MQRAAASSSSPSTPSLPSAKRQKLNDPTHTSPSDAQAIQEALAAEEAKRTAALDRQRAEAGETKWVFSYQKEAIDEDALKVVKAGYAEVDSQAMVNGQETQPWQEVMVGRRSFGKFNRALEKRLDPFAESSSSDGDSNSEDSGVDANKAGKVGGTDDGGNDPSGMEVLIQGPRSEAAERAKLERKVQRKESKAAAARLAEKRKSKEVKLNRLSSISGGGGSGAAGKLGSANMECYVCGQKGHGKKDCPERKSKRARTNAM